MRITGAKYEEKPLYNNHRRGIQWNPALPPKEVRAQLQGEPAAACPPQRKRHHGGAHVEECGAKKGKGEMGGRRLRGREVQDWVYSEYSEEYSRRTHKYKQEHRV